MLKVKFSWQAAKKIEKLIKKQPKLVSLLYNLIHALRINPNSAGYKKITNSPCYRVRIGNYRIVYEYDDIYLYITVVEKRDKVYKLMHAHYHK